ncbi:phosphopantetheinyl transferase [Xylariaceae sp. FL0016]|nr:phosphopantetheinyl transferase [Xylariaceae sp. FL0016]
MATKTPQVIQYLVDTRKLWPAATKTKQLETYAARALKLLTPEEKTKVLKFFFVADAKLALLSHLLKHWVVSKYAGVPWSQTHLSADANKKPVYVDPATGQQPVAFNVSHQAGIVSLVAVAAYGGGDGDKGLPAQVGTDMVCTSERRARDLRMIETEGWGRFVDMHADVFGTREAAYLRDDGALVEGAGLRGLEGEALTDGKLRVFYALWCLREAYVKMTGEALLAPWLHDLSFEGLKAPKPGREFRQSDGEEDETIRTHNVVFKGSRVEDANICLRSLGPDYMTCSAVRTPGRKDDALGWELGPYEFLSVDEIIAHGECASG